MLDVEDAVDPSRKASARAGVVDWLRAGGRAWIRINARSTTYWPEDVDALIGIDGLAGVLLAKTEAAEHVTETFDRLGGRVPVLPLIESAMGIEEAVSITRARGTFRLAFGSGDYRRDTGTSADDLAMAYPRSRLVVASRVGNLPGPIDGPTIGSAHPILREHAQTAVALGLTGSCPVPRRSPAPGDQRSRSPTPSDVAWAREFLADFESPGASSAMAATFRGSVALKRSNDSRPRSASTGP